MSHDDQIVVSEHRFGTHFQMFSLPYLCMTRGQVGEYKQVESTRRVVKVQSDCSGS